jgi:hypothetical protein
MDAVSESESSKLFDDCDITVALKRAQKRKEDSNRHYVISWHVNLRMGQLLEELRNSAAPAA